MDSKNLKNFIVVALLLNVVYISASTLNGIYRDSSTSMEFHICNNGTTVKGSYGLYETGGQLFATKSSEGVYNGVYYEAGDFVGGITLSINEHTSHVLVNFYESSIYEGTPMSSYDLTSISITPTKCPTNGNVGGVFYNPLNKSPLFICNIKGKIFGTSFDSESQQPASYIEGHITAGNSFVGTIYSNQGTTGPIFGYVDNTDKLQTNAWTYTGDNTASFISFGWPIKISNNRISKTVDVNRCKLGYESLLHIKSECDQPEEKTTFLNEINLYISDLEN